MTRDQFVEWARKQGFRADRHGHLQMDDRGRTYRFKLSRIAARHEVKSGAGWVRIRSGYFSKLSLTPDGRIAGMAR